MKQAGCHEFLSLIPRFHLFHEFLLKAQEFSAALIGYRVLLIWTPNGVCL